MNFLEILQQTKTEPGRSELLKENHHSDNKVSVVERICGSIVAEDYWHHLSFVELRRVLWILRNCCSGDEKVIGIIQQYNIIVYFYNCFRSAADQNMMPSVMDTENDSSSSTETRFSTEEMTELLFILLQFYCNFCSISNSSPTMFFEILGFEELFHLLALTNQLHSRKSLGTIWHLVYLLVCSQKLDYERRLNLLLASRGLLCGLFLSLQHSATTSQDSTEQQKQAEVEASIQEWSQLLLLQLIKENRVRELFDILDSRHSQQFVGTTEQSTISIVNMEQIILLHLLLSMVEDSWLKSEFLDPFLIEVTFVNFMKHTVIKYLLLIEIESLFPTMRLSTAKTTTSSYDPFQLSLYQDYCLVFLELLASVLNLYESKAEQQDSSSKSDSVVSGCSLKRDLEFIRQIILSSFHRMKNWDFIHRKRREKETKITYTLTEFEKDFIKFSLQLTSFLVYRNLPLAQTFANDKQEVLHSILSYCTTDIELPLAREWALLTIRNLCEQSVEVQQYISSLRPQEVKMDDEALRRLNKEIRFDPTTGKLNVEESKN